MKGSAQDLLQKAKQTLLGNLKEGHSQRLDTNYKYICPSKEHYFHQWFWDSCFHAIVLSHLDNELAKNEIDSLLFVQRKNGFIPHIIYWDSHKYSASLSNLGQRLESRLELFPESSELIQPPLIAEAVEAIFKSDKDVRFLKRVLPKLKKYYLWLSKNRDPDQDGLISIIAPYESGLDQSPSYDPILNTEEKPQLLSALLGRTVTLRNMLKNYNLNKIFAADYFNVEDVLVNSIYIKNLNVLSKLLLEIDDEESARDFHTRATKATRSLIKKCYDRKDGFFYDVYGKGDKRAKVKTIKGLIPLILDLPKSVVNNLTKHVINNSEFASAFPLPTVSMDEPSFEPKPLTVKKEPIIWRGPTWINTNWYIASGLRKHGYKKEADHITKKSVELIEKNGFREFFNPFSGEGYGAHNFSWSTLVVDMILS